MSGFSEEVQRRKVYRVAAAYVVVAGGIIQLASAVFPAWELPNWSFKLVVVLLLIGFPLALILAWAFDVTPQGVRVTEPVTPSRKSRRNLVMLLVLGLFVSAIAGFFLLPRAASAGKVDKSIAVLPFVNLSDDKENAYFADGMQDDILTNLSKISDLKVISRTSVMAYREKPASVREIGKTLGVATVLEGSVRRDKSTNRVRVNVQLISAADDKHLWAQEYDRDLNDVFGIQSDLAQKIADELQAKLSPEEKAQLAHKPTENHEAYVAFMEAGSMFDPEDRNKLLQAESRYQKAIELDPKFALAYAKYSHLVSWIYHSFDMSEERNRKARLLAEQALSLDPNLPEAHIALGYCYYYGEGDYARALSEFEKAKDTLPNDSEALLALGAIQRRQGKWDESTSNLKRALEVNPKDMWVLQNLALNYVALRQFEEADKLYDRGLASVPGSPSLSGGKGQLYLTWKGDPSVADAFLKAVPNGFDPAGIITFSRIRLLMYRRQYPEAIALLEKLPENLEHGSFGAGQGQVPKCLLLGIAHLLNGEKAKAMPEFEKARGIFEQLVAKQPNDPTLRGQLGLIYATLGRREEAIREGKRAVEILPESKDAYDGPMATLGLAQIYAWTGDNDESVALIERSLQTPNGVTVAQLKDDGIYDPLRKDPRFQVLIEKYATKN